MEPKKYTKAKAVALIEEAINYYVEDGDWQMVAAFAEELKYLAQMNVYEVVVSPCPMAESEILIQTVDDYNENAWEKL